MQAFELTDLITSQNQSGQDYLEILKVPDLSVGLYTLPAGGVDKQTPHTEDEIFYVLAGSATVLVGNENREVSAGSLIYVPANVEHNFHSIINELRLLVVFAPAEYTKAPR
jgi:mannose-6-phosphate isomerase-like protein (cupin superfamily)